MGYFQVRYDSRVIIYDGSAFIRLTTGLQFYKYGFICFIMYHIFSFVVLSYIVKLQTSCTVILLPTYSECSLSQVSQTATYQKV